MATVSPDQLPTEYVEVQTSDTISVSGSSVTILSVSATPFLPEGISITSAGSSITISGKYPIGLFDSSELKTIERGKSDKSSEVITHSSFDDVTDDRQVYSYKAPSNPRVTITFNINVHEIDDLTMTESLSSFTVSKIIEFSYDKGKNALRRYI